MIKLKPTIHGHVRVVKHNDEGEITQDLSFDNVVLTEGYRELARRMIDPAAPMALTMVNWLFLGTGTTEPLVTDAGLENRSGTLGGLQSLAEGHSLGSPTGHRLENSKAAILDPLAPAAEFRATYRFPYAQGQAEGVWTELGLADQNYSEPLTRALFRDDAGDPISITVLSDEYLTVFYTLVLEFDNVWQTGQVTVDGQPVDYDFSVTNNATTESNWYNGGSFYNRFSFNNFHAFHYQDKLFGTRRACSGLNITRYTNGYPDPDVASFSGYDTQYEAAEYSSTLSYDFATNTVTIEVIFTPSDNDKSIEAIKLSQDGFTGGSFLVWFETPIVKRADYRLTITLEIDFSPVIGGV